MNLKNFFKAFSALFLAFFLFASCEKQPILTDEQKQEVYLFGNCTDFGMHGYLMGYDDNKSHTYSAASLLSMPALTEKGEYLLGVRAYIGDEVTNASVWAGEDYKNPTYNKDFTYKKGGWQYVMFDEPIKLNANEPDIYIGYTVTGKGPSILAAESAKKGYKSEWICIDGDWSLLSKKAGNALWSIQAIVTGGDYTAENQHNIVVECLTAPMSVNGGDAVNVTCEVRNAGIKQTGPIEVKCNFGGSSVTATISEPLMNGQSTIVMLPAITAPNVGGVSDLVVSASEVNVTDDVAKDNEVKKSIRVYTESVPRNCVYIEYFTGQDCPNCPRGMKAMSGVVESLTDPDKVAWVAHHTYYTDDFSLVESAYIADYLQAYFAPACNFNRLERNYGLGKEELIWLPDYATKELLEQALMEPGLATMNVVREYNSETRELTVEVKGRSIEKVAYITAVLTQSGIEARQSGANGTYVHNNAPRAFLTAAKGDKLELDAEGNYTKTFTYTIPESVGVFDCLPENMEFVSFIHGAIDNASTRLVYNADHVSVVPDVEAAVMLYDYEVEYAPMEVELKPLFERICR